MRLYTETQQRDTMLAVQPVYAYAYTANKTHSGMLYKQEPVKGFIIPTRIKPPQTITELKIVMDEIATSGQYVRPRYFAPLKSGTDTFVKSKMVDISSRCYTNYEDEAWEGYLEEIAEEGRELMRMYTVHEDYMKKIIKTHPEIRLTEDNTLKGVR